MAAVISTTQPVAVQHLWTGPERSFACWYVNLQEPMRPTPIGLDNQDLELDIVIAPSGEWIVKDDELLDQRVAEGRWTPDEAAAIRAIGHLVIRDVIEPGAWWWDPAWATWTADPSLVAPRLPRGWADVPCPPSTASKRSSDSARRAGPSLASPVAGQGSTSAAERARSTASASALTAWTTSAAERIPATKREDWP